MNKLKKEKQYPPQLPLRFFRWFCHPKLRDYIEGDLMELYEERKVKLGKLKADIKFIQDVLLLFRPGIIKPFTPSNHLNHTGMFRNYFAIGWRNMTKQKMYSGIKVGGFAVGIAACMLIGLYIQDELNFDKHFPKGNRLFRVLGVINKDGEIIRDVHFPAPFAEAIKNDYPEVEEVARLNPVVLFGAGSNEVRRVDKQEGFHEEDFTFIDQSMLNMLDVPMVAGVREQALNRPNTIVISKSKADKYFPNEDPLGKVLILNNDESKQYTVGGVMEDFPTTSHLQYHFLVTLNGINFYDGEQTNWGASNYPTYVLIREDANPQELAQKMHNLFDKYWLPLLIKEGVPNAKELSKSVWFELQPITDIYLRSTNIQDGLAHGDVRLVWLFGGVAFFILVIACINFINLSTAKSANRAKEVGIRKVLGSYNNQLINQFLTESLLFSFVSFLFGIVLVQLTLPYFNQLANKNIAFPWQAWWLVPGILVAAITVGFLAGLYPSFYLSSFRPIQTLKGNLGKGGKPSITRSTLVVFQFSISIILIICTFVIYRQMEFVLTKNLGFTKEQVVLVQGTNMLGKQVETFKKELLELPGVKNVSVTDYLPIKGTKRNGNGFYKGGHVNEGEAIGGQNWVVDDSYIKTLGMKMVSGRDFSNELASDSAAAIINQKMAHALGYDNPIGQTIANGGTTWNIIGVVQDFHFETMREEIQPLILRLGSSPNITSIQLSTTDMQKNIDGIAQTWKKFSPYQSIRFTFLDESYARMYDDVKRMRQIFTGFAALGILVASLGLFALSAFMAEQRSKEVSIRMVLGASTQSIVQLLTQNFIKLVVIAFVIAAPLAWMVMNHWLKDYAYKAELTWQVFILSGLMAVIIALLTVSYQAIVAALANPAQNLRSE